jgi:hypothetical protein
VVQFSHFHGLCRDRDGHDHARTAKSFEDALGRAFPEDGEARETFRMRIENTLFVQLLVGAEPERKGFISKLLSLMALINPSGRTRRFDANVRNHVPALSQRMDYLATSHFDCARPMARVDFMARVSKRLGPPLMAKMEFRVSVVGRSKLGGVGFGHWCGDIAE